MRAHVIVLLEPVIDNDLSLLSRIEPFSIENFATQRTIEALIVSVLPRRPRIDADRFDARTREPKAAIDGLEVSLSKRLQLLG